jgi:hypothetical protein
MVRSRAERVADQIRITDAARIRFAHDLRNGASVRGTDLAALARVEALLEGEATERMDVTEVRAWMGVLFDGLFGFIPDDRKEEALDWAERELAELPGGTARPGVAQGLPSGS